MAAAILWTALCTGALAAAPGEGRLLAQSAIASDEVVIYTHHLIVDYGADNTGKEDCTAKIQQALDAAGRDDGGIVFAPAGRYRILGHLTIPPGVTLMGEWQNPGEHPAAAGTVLCAYERGSIPFITLQTTATLKKLGIWYPEQRFAAPVAYPWTTWADHGTRHGIEDVTFYNSYCGINEGAAWDGDPRGKGHGASGSDHVRNIYGTFLSLGLTHCNSGNSSVFAELHMSPKYWTESGLPRAPALPAAQQVLREFLRSNAVGLKAYGEQHLHKEPKWWVHLDCTQYHQVYIEDVKLGIDFQVDWADLVDVNIRNARTGIFVRATSGFFGIGILGGRIDALAGEGTCGIKYPANSRGKHIAIQGLTIGGQPTYGIDFDGNKDDSLNVMKCVFENWQNCAIYARNGTAMIEACTFNRDATQVYLSPQVQGAAILGNCCRGARPIENHSLSSDVKIDHTPLGIPDLPASLTQYRYLPKRKPLRPENFFNVAAAPYRAVKGGRQDCTAAMQRALDDAAAAGGGTVFVPGGVWRLDGTLIIPGGVELRGINTHPHNHGLAGTNLFSYANKGNENGAPFITMRSGSQANGFFVFYPEMALDCSTRYPWSIRGNGTDIYLRNVSFINSWNGLDLGTCRCDGFRASGCSGSTHNLHIYVGGGSANWILEDCMNTWSFDVGYPSPIDGHIIGFQERGKLCKVGNDVPGANLPYKIGAVANGVLFNLLSYDPGRRVALMFADEGAGARDLQVLLLKADVCHGLQADKGEHITVVLPRISHDCNIVSASFTGTIDQFMELAGYCGGGAYTRVDGGTVNTYQGHGSPHIECNGGVLHAFGLAFVPPSMSKPEKIKIGAAAKLVQLIGCNAVARDGIEAGGDLRDRVILRNNIGQKSSAMADSSAAPATKLRAKWIWLAPAAGPIYNQTVIARRSLRLEKPRRGSLLITADSFYRLYVNDQWVADGPCRSWPEHYQYDVLDVSNYLRNGDNRIEVVARYYGVGDFHKVPQRPGLLVQFDAVSAGGGPVTLLSDDSWEVAEAHSWVDNTPKASVQMEPFELYDARLAGDLKFHKATVICDAEGGPWKGLHPRDVALLTRQPVAFRSFGGAHTVRCQGWDFCLPAPRLMHPGLIEANHNALAPCGMATLLDAEQGCALNVQLEGMRLAIDGKPVATGERRLVAGKHLLLAFVSTLAGHDKEKSVRFLDPKGFRLVNPLDATYSNPWCFIPLPEFNFAGNDLIYHWFSKENVQLTETAKHYYTEVDRLFRQIRSPQDFASQLASKAKLLAADAMFVQDCMWQFENRQVLHGGDGLVQDPAALMNDTAAATVIQPAADGDVELMYDLGEQNCGYYTFDLVAPAGTIVDIFAVEYIAPDGRIQFSLRNRNGLRYIAREGVNRYTSLKRRSGRYVFLTLRNQQGPVRVRHFGLIESTYPINAVGSFACSDARLDKIWEISTRTLKLCMEDTFVDCPLYEQTHWVGDARNESLLAYPVFGATDLGRRCIRLTGQSLERYPIAGCQTPSCWDVLLPAWSFLWGISTWDHYWYTGDKQALREAWPDAIRNLKGAEKYVNEQGLFSAPFWNMFDWTPSDQQHKTVLHNTMFMVGAIDAAIKEGEVLGDAEHVAWLRGLRSRMTAAVNRLWDPQKKAYPDSVHEDGSLSGSTSQHTSFLAILYDIVEPAHLADARRNILDPPAGMVGIGSPFAVLYLYEALEKLGMEERIIAEIYRNYLPMLEAGATTVWESFPSGTTGLHGFPTRSHCHAWSSAPSYFLNRIVLGIKPSAPGGSTIRISPQLSGLAWARGSVATMRGAVSVSWRLDGPNGLQVTCTAPAGVQVSFARNSSHDGKDVYFNGKRVE